MAVVKEVTTPEYTVRVHDDYYVSRTPEEINESAARISNTVFESQKRRLAEESA